MITQKHICEQMAREGVKPDFQWESDCLYYVIEGRNWRVEQYGKGRWDAGIVPWCGY